MEKIMDYEMVKKLYELLGPDGFLEHFKVYCPDYELYRYGLDWLHDRKYILKFRGTNGDLIIYWK